MLDRRRLEVALEYWLPTPLASFPFTCPPVHHRVPPGSKQALLQNSTHHAHVNYGTDDYTTLEIDFNTFIRE